MIAADWRRMAQAARMHDGEWEVVIQKSGWPEQKLASRGWRPRLHAPGLDLLAEGGGRGAAPMLSLYWGGPRRGVGLMVGGRKAGWPEFAEAMQKISTHSKHEQR